MTSHVHACNRPSCPNAGLRLEFEHWVVQAFDHVFEEIDRMTNAIQDLTQADADSAAVQLQLETAVAGLASEQLTFLADIRADLAGLGNNDQVSAIAVKIETRTAALSGIVAQVGQLQADQVAEDAADAPAAPISTTDPTQTPDETPVAS